LVPINVLPNLQAHIARLTPLTEAQQVQHLTDLLQAETEWRSELISAHGTKPYEPLQDVHAKYTTAYFRIRESDQTTLFSALKAQRWEEVATLRPNHRFIAWTKTHTTPTPAMVALEAKIVRLRTKLVESIFKLIVKQSLAFALGSKIKTVTPDDLVALGTMGALMGTDKYTPDGPVSARAWKSVVLGRISEQHLTTKSNTTAHLWKEDARRLASLRAGRVPASEITDDDLQLQEINRTVTISTARGEDEDGRLLGFDIADPGLNPEEAMIAREEEAERARALAHYQAQQEAQKQRHNLSGDDKSPPLRTDPSTRRVRSSTKPLPRPRK
jgi:hypothetical protein